MLIDDHLLMTAEEEGDQRERELMRRASRRRSEQRRREEGNCQISSFVSSLSLRATHGVRFSTVSSVRKNTNALRAGVLCYFGQGCDDGHHHQYQQCVHVLWRRTIDWASSFDAYSHDLRLHRFNLAFFVDGVELWERREKEEERWRERGEREKRTTRS